ncbi:MAG: methyltransferase domain-containing protein [Aestuariivita sp.]|nr:methyltransferase domain-containing protein [Aestuariivita sp.]
MTGINNNDYQIERAKKHYQESSVACRFIKGDFMKVPENDEYFHAAYIIEAAVHAPNPEDLYREMWRILRPGGMLASYEWCMTGDFNREDTNHQQIKRDIMIGNGLPDIPYTSQVCAGLQAAGFELIDAHDRALDSEQDFPWYHPLQGNNFSISGIPRTPWGRALVNFSLRIGESVRAVPKGSRMVSTLLNTAADALVEGGKGGVFTPMYFVLARKGEVTDLSSP